MKKETAVALLESLASDVRLEVYRLLVREAAGGMVAGEIANEMDLLPTSLSFHLKALSQARLVSVEQEGRFLRYRANMPLMLDLIGYLTAECCAGNPELCDVPVSMPQARSAASRPAARRRARERSR